MADSRAMQDAMNAYYARDTEGLCRVITRLENQPSKLKQIADDLEDGDGHSLTEILDPTDKFIAKKYGPEVQQQLGVIVSWVFTEEDELRARFAKPVK